MCPKCERKQQILGVLSVKIIVCGNKVSNIGEIFLNSEIMSKLIELTKMDTRRILVNSDLIETVEATPDTVLILYSGRKLLVKESPEEIIRIIGND